MPDSGLTHVALPVRDLDASLAFYERFANLRPVHRREGHDGHRVAWIADGSCPFVIVLIQSGPVEHRLLAPAHLGVACASRAEVDRLVELARREGCLLLGPTDSEPPVGYWAFLRDPDGHVLEVSYGQVVATTVEQAHLSPLDAGAQTPVGSGRG